MPKVRFLEDRIVRDGSGTSFEKGRVYDLPDASAERWLRRGAAEAVSNRAHAGEPKRYDAQGSEIKPTPEDAARTADAAEAEAKQKAAAEGVARKDAERKEAERIAAEAAAEAARKTADRAKVKIPAQWADMPWHDMRALAAELTDDPVRSKEEAAAAIQAELKRRG